jgi:fructokinase
VHVMRQIMNKFSLSVVALTRGSHGSILMDNKQHSEFAGQPTMVVDTVGAGDSFTACLALGLSRHWSLDAINRWANQVAAYVCSQAGATPEMPTSLHMSKQAV